MHKIMFSLLAVVFMSCSPNQPANKQDATNQSDSISKADTLVSVETAAVPDLSGYFVEVKKGAYAEVQAKSASQSVNGIYCYFRLKAKKASNMRLHIQYWDDAYADVDHYRFNVDGKTYDFTANRNKETSAGGAVLQGSTFYWYDNNVNKTDQAFLKALSEAKQASLNLIDRGTNSVVATITISEQVKEDIKRTFDYYFSLDGALIPRAGMVNIRD